MYDKWVETGNDHYRIVLAISFVSLIVSRIKSYNIENPDDVLSEMTARIYEQIKKYDPEKASIYTYIYRVVSTKIIDYWRKQKRRNAVYTDLDDEEIQKRLLMQEEPFSDSFERICKNEEAAYVREAISGLSKSKKRLITLRYYDELSINRICNIMNITRSKYKKMDAEAMSEMGKILSKIGEDK